MKYVLLVGQQNDPHIKAIENELNQINQKHIVLDKFSSRNTFSVFYNDGTKSIVNLDNFTFTNDEIKSIWNTSALRISLNDKIDRETHKFAQAEWSEGITTLWNSIPARWINSPVSISKSVNRLEQLKHARSIGLSTPKSLVTNDPENLLNFYEECAGNIIGKTLHSSEGVPEGKMIFTTKISKEDLKKIDDLRYAPCLFQEYIPKKTELRITIIGDTLHVAEIYSQKSEKTKHDWRNYDDFSKTPYVKSEIPDNISKKLLMLMKKMNLEFGAADLIRTPTDEFVFLEINPNGRWWWIQELTGMNIAQDIAKNLSL